VHAGAFRHPELDENLRCGDGRIEIGGIVGDAISLPLIPFSYPAFEAMMRRWAIGYLGALNFRSLFHTERFLYRICQRQRSARLPCRRIRFSSKLGASPGLSNRKCFPKIGLRCGSAGFIEPVRRAE
jgi:hypothetical protein